MRVAWLQDKSGNTDGTGEGGAEFTARELEQGAPDGVEVVYVPPDELEKVRDCDVVCVHNSTQYPSKTIKAVRDKRVVRYWNDVAPHGDGALKRWLVRRAQNVFLSPLHYRRFPWLNGEIEHWLIPPPVDLRPFREAAERVGDRSGSVSVSAWRGWGKSPARTIDWAQTNGVALDFYGSGPLAPRGSEHVPYDRLPDLLARYERFVYLPAAVEPFCRLVAEAWAAGCELVVNKLVGATYWIENEPEKIETAADDYWKLVCDG